MKRTFITLGLLFASTALAVSLKPLPAADSVQTAVTDIALEWSDGNISTGTSAASASALHDHIPTTQLEWRSLAQDLLKVQFKLHTGRALPKSAKLRITSAELRPEHLQRAVMAVAEGNAYDTSNPANLEPILIQANTMISSLGRQKDIYFLAVKTRLPDSSRRSERRNIRIHVFLNVTTGKLVQIFTIEGTI